MRDKRFTVRREFRRALSFQHPGMGRVETFLNCLSSSTCPKNPVTGKREFVHCHPFLYWPACRLLHFMGWWHYRIQHSGASCGSRICWDGTHWRNGVLGPLAASLAAQIHEHDTEPEPEPTPDEIAEQNMIRNVMNKPS